MQDGAGHVVHLCWRSVAHCIQRPLTAIDGVKLIPGVDDVSRTYVRETIGTRADDLRLSSNAMPHKARALSDVAIQAVDGSLHATRKKM